GAAGGVVELHVEVHVRGVLRCVPLVGDTALQVGQANGETVGVDVFGAEFFLDHVGGLVLAFLLGGVLGGCVPVFLGGFQLHDLVLVGGVGVGGGQYGQAEDEGTGDGGLGGLHGGLLHACVGGWSWVRPGVRRTAGGVRRVDRNQHVTPGVKSPRSDLTTRVI